MRMMMDADYPGFKVIDDATGAEIKDVLWVDYWALEYATGTGQARSLSWNSLTGAITVHEVDETVTQITRFSVNWAAREIHVNEPALVSASAPKVERKPCADCCQESTCRRINYCAAWRCAFGEVAKP